MKIDFAKRRRVMERSQLLGHCICDPRRPCPCDVFRDQGICPCAGERPDPVAVSDIKLTRSVRNAGCASKIAPGDLEAFLSRLPAVNDSAVISGLAAADDAAIYRISEDLCLIQTVDVFTPCVDDPYLFGRICAANCLSDIYATGGEPRTALSILAFPSESLDGEIMFQMLSGAMETLAEAGVALVGGHSIKDEEIKLGFAVTGVVDPAVAAALDSPRAGDVLVLTKPLGTGVIAFSKQIGRELGPGAAEAEASMTLLNRAAAEVMKEAGASACTDITGFGLFGHLRRMLRQGGLGAVIFADRLPAFEGVMPALAAGVVPGAIERNREFVGNDLLVQGQVDETMVHLGFDAQTSGGLLIAIPRNAVFRFTDSLARRGGHSGFLIGELLTISPGEPAIRLASHSPASGLSATSTDKVPSPSERLSYNPHESMNSEPSPTGHDHGTECCADVFGGKTNAESAIESQRAFGALMRATQTPGALDAKTKELIVFGMVVLSRCGGCFDAHYRKAVEMGITHAELEESAWCAIAMGGAPVRMFYEESVRRLRPGKS